MKFDIPHKAIGDFSLPVLGLGTWQMGGRYERDPGNDDERDIQAVRQATRLGITHIDTAEIYAAGHAEELVAEAIKDCRREQLFITSKVGPGHMRYDDVLRAARDSLRRLGLTYLDLYLVHTHNQAVPLKDTMRAMDKLVDEGLVKHIGVSNFDAPFLEEAQSHSRYPIVNNQIHYNLAVRHYAENGTLAYCEKRGILVTAYRPLAKGDFGEKGQAILNRLAEKYQKPPVAVALNWLVAQPNIVTIVKSSNPLHLQEDLQCLGWELAVEDRAFLDQNFPRGSPIYGPRS